MSFQKSYEQAKADYKPMNRSQITRATGKMRSAHRRISAQQNRHKPMNKVGSRTREWQAAWRFLKPRLQAAGRTRCEFDWPEVQHECWGPLDPAHSKKRDKMKENDIYAVAISCREFHRYLDEMLTHEAMEKLVLEAINRHGGMILPSQNLVVAQ